MNPAVRATVTSFEIDRWLEPACVIDEGGHFVHLNVQLEALLGRANLTGRPFVELLCEGDRAAWCDWLGLPNAMTESIEVRLLCPGKEPFWATVGAPAKQSGWGGSWRVLSVLDVDARKRAQLALFDSEDRFDAFMDAHTAPSWMKNATGHYVYVNQAWEKSTGLARANVIGKHAAQLFSETVAERVTAFERAVIASGKPSYVSEIEHEGRAFQTVCFLFWDHLGNRYLGGLAFDITAERQAANALRELEDQLRHSQKMEAIGRLAGGVAHDFNNLLAVILGCTSSLLGRLPPHDPARRELEEIALASTRASELTRQLLTFSRQTPATQSAIELHAELTPIASLARRLLGHDVELRTDWTAKRARVNADVGQLSQVVINLVVNANDAMPEGGGLTLSTHDVERDGGSWVRLSVSDSGLGMDEATRARACEPFFTTKPPGKGTGLGLATVFGIVQQWGGAMSIESAAGQGTRIDIELPVLEPTPPAALKSETILLVDDDDQVRRVTRLSLEDAGYRVSEAARGDEALALLRGAEFDLLLTDVTLPQMNGGELAAQARALKPALKVLLMSGGAPPAARTASPVLLKPFTLEALTRRVQTLLRG